MIDANELTGHRTIELDGNATWLTTVFDNPMAGWIRIDETFYAITEIIDDRHLTIAVPKARIAHLN